jgi:hypothetical protein
MKQFILTISLIIVVVSVGYAQAPPLPPTPAGGGGGGGGGGGSVAAPLDGFTWMLLLSGFGYGAKTIRDRREL